MEGLLPRPSFDGFTKKTQKVISLVYYVLLIVIIVLLVWQLVKNHQKKERLEKKQEQFIGENEERPFPEEVRTGDNKPQRRERIEETSTPDLEPFAEYDLDGVDQFNFNEESDSEEEQLFNFEDLKRAAEDRDFIHRFSQSLKKSYQLKLDRYLPMYKVNEFRLNDLKGRQQRGMPPSVEYTRALGLKSDLDAIIDTLKHRLKHQKESEVKRAFKKILYQRDKGFQAIIGQDHIKDDVARNLYCFSNNPKLFLSGFQNLIILGNQGLGKTKLAKCLSYIYSKSGILCRKRCEVIKGTDLVSPFVSDTPGHATNILERLLECYLAVDEAHDLGPDDPMDKDHGKQAIDAFLAHLEKFAGLQIISFHGYKEPFNRRVLARNQGLKRRFKHTYELTDYTPTELTKILIRALEEKGAIVVSEKEARALAGMIVHVHKRLPRAFDDQAGDMDYIADEVLTLSSISKGKHYEKGKESDNIRLFKRGVESYLGRKLKGEIDKLY